MIISCRIHIGESVSFRCNNDNSARFHLLQMLKEQVCHEKHSIVIRCHRIFKAILTDFLTKIIWNSSIVYQHIDLWFSFNYNLSKFTNALETRQIEMVNYKIRVACIFDDFICKISIIAVFWVTDWCNNDDHEKCWWTQTLNSQSWCMCELLQRIFFINFKLIKWMDHFLLISQCVAIHPTALSATVYWIHAHSALTLDSFESIYPWYQSN